MITNQNMNTMNEIEKIKNTMTSLEIAEVTGKRHSDVLEAIRTMEPAWEKVCQRKFPLMFKIRKLPNGGETRDPYYLLNKAECLYIATKFNDEARARLIIRWEELEKKNRPQLPVTYLDALKALVKAEEEKQQLTIENKEMQPKADYFDSLVDRKLLTNFRDTAKQLHVKQKEFIQWLIDGKYIFRKGKKLLPYQSSVEQGLFELKDYCNGEYADKQTLITPKGKETFKLLLENRKDIA